MILDSTGACGSACVAKTIRGIAEEATDVISIPKKISFWTWMRFHGSPSNQRFWLTAKRNVIWKVECVLPIHDLTVPSGSISLDGSRNLGPSAVHSRVVGFFSTKRRPPDETFKHDCTHGPPIATESITLSTEDLWSYVVWSPHGGISHDSARLTPCVDLATIAYSQVDLVE